MFGDLLRRSARQFRDLPAIRHDERALTYRDLFERSCRLANALAAGGIARGEVVASLGRNRLESMEQFTAVALGGFVRSPLYWQDAAERQAFMLRRVGAAALIVDKAVWPVLKDTLGREGIALKLVLVRDEDHSASRSELAYDAALDAASPTDPKVPTDDDATWVIRFSAGTTGLPKPIAHSERGYHLANQEVMLAGPAIDETDAYLAVSPYSHGSGNLVWPFIARGASHVVINGFDAERALEQIEKHRCTTLFLVPTMIQRLLDSPHCRDADLSTIRRIIYGAAPIPQEMIKAALSVFGDTLYQTTDRKDDMIISGGFNIAPAEVEDALTRHPQVAEAVVFGAPHPQWGSSPVAVVRLHAPASVGDLELIQWCQERIGSLKKPSRVIITTDPLPISSAGKLLRRVARERYGALLG